MGKSSPRCTPPRFRQGNLPAALGTAAGTRPWADLGQTKASPTNSCNQVGTCGLSSTLPTSLDRRHRVPLAVCPVDDESHPHAEDRHDDEHRSQRELRPAPPGHEQLGSRRRVAFIRHWEQTAVYLKLRYLPCPTGAVVSAALARLGKLLTNRANVSRLASSRTSDRNSRSQRNRVRCPKSI